MNRLDACFPRCEGEAPAIQQRLTRGSLLASAGGLAVLSTFVALILGTALSGIIAHAEQSGPTAPTTSREQTHQRTTAMKISIRTQHKVITATLADNETSRDFVSLLPITLTLKDYAATEKVSDLPRRLSTEGAPAGSDPSIGDIAYYSPWGNLAIFYQNFRYSSGLIKLGKIDTGIEELNVPEGTKVMIELIEKPR